MSSSKLKIFCSLCNNIRNYSSKVSKFDHFNEFGPPLKSNVYKSKQPTKPVKRALTKTQPQAHLKDTEKSKENIIGNRQTNSIEASSHVSIFNDQRPACEVPSTGHSILKLPYQYTKSVASVSRVLSATMSDESKEALARWEAEKIALMGEFYFKQYKEAMFSRGKTLHSMLETFLETRTLPTVKDLDDEVSKRHLLSISRMIHGVDAPLIIESALTHPDLGYSGIVDCVAVINNTVTLIDWKTSDKVKNTVSALYDNPLQLAAYIGAFNRDPAYEHLGNITHGAVAVVYNSGYPAMIHSFSGDQLCRYWDQWCLRLEQYKSMSSN